ncbi:MAG TPA: 3-dehydroquinate synthase [bacterium]|nr:3-dehydroquinate synthase [bacterium]
MRHNVVLIGFMGTGKTVVGRALASRLRWPFVDTDALVEQRAGRSIPRIFAEDGEATFRRLEADVVAAVGESQGMVIATGGGVVLNRDNMARLRRNGVIVALRAGVHAILARLDGDGDRPLLGADPEGSIRRLLTERGPLYEDADLVVDTSLARADDTVRVIEMFATTWRGRSGDASPPGAGSMAERVVRVATRSRGYDVRIGRGLIGDIGDHLRGLGMTGRIAVLTHPRLEGLYGDRVTSSLRAAGYEAVTVTVPPSETSKSLRAANRLYDRLLEARLDRGSVLVVLGGGVAGDLGGFVAATFLRGIAWAAIPTTLLAQVDAAIGGKTAVNHSRGKNLVGAVHQPVLVVSDIDTLGSLPLREMQSGMAEVIKTGVIGSPGLFSYLEDGLKAVLRRDPDALATVVARCAAYKAGVVTSDEREEAGRIVLNYGHTIGHGIEAAAGYRGLTHGEAVAVGMTLEGRLAVRMGLCDAASMERQAALLRGAGLPVRVADLRTRHRPSAGAIAAAMALDKKARAGRLRFVLPVEVGRTVVRDDVPATLVEEVLGDA